MDHYERILEEIKKTQFATVRLREGYDVDEVDGFLDRMEKEVAHLVSALRNEQQRTAVLPAVSEAPSAAAARLLDMAQRTADTAIEEGQAEANKIMAEAHHEASVLLAQARNEAESMVENARAVAEREGQETRQAFARTAEEERQRHTARVADLEAKYVELDKQIKNMAATARRYRVWAARSVELLNETISDDPTGDSNG